jgi:hypothetical protein
MRQDEFEFNIIEHKGLFYVVEDQFEWVADIRNSLADAQLSANYYNSNCQGEPPFPDLQ